MKKQIIILIGVVLFVSSCNISRKQLQRGQYDLAVNTAVVKLQRKPTKEKEILVLEEAFPKAVEKDKDRIKYLHTEGKPDRWEEIFQIYSHMKARQSMVKTVTPLKLPGRTINFSYSDYDKLIVEAKRKAAAYFYAHAKKLMQQNDRFAYRQAFDELVKTKNYVSTYSDVETLLIQCKDLGTTHALLIAVNSTIYKLSNDFMVNLIDHQTGDLNSMWVMYHTKDDKKGNYNVNIEVILEVADVSANDIRVKRRTETKEVKDGWDYVLDEEGNVKKDTLGNPIKVPRYKIIRCDVIETIQFKEAHVGGEIKYINTENSQVIRSFPIGADHVFEWVYTVANGDLDALSPETRKRLGNRPVPYPSDIDMLWGANETLRNVIINSIHSNRRILERW